MTEVLGVVARVGVYESPTVVAKPFGYMVVGSVGVIGRGADMSAVGSYPRGRVESETKPFGVNVVGERLHIGECLVGLDGVVFPAAKALPCHVDVHVCPAVVDQIVLDESVGCGLNILLRDVVSPAVPAVPPHGRCQGETVADDDAQVADVGSEGVGRREAYGVFSGLLDASRDASAPGVELETFG